MLKRRPSTLIIIAIVVLAIIGGYYGMRAWKGNSRGALKASGTIEATTVNVSPELAGKVEQVLVQEGQPVKQGQPLFRLDDTLLQAQKQAAVAGLQVAQTAALTTQAASASAQAQYTIALSAARSAARPQRLADWAGKTPDYFNQPKWYFTQEEQIAAAQVELAASQSGLTTSQNNLAGVVSDLQNAGFIAAEKRLSNARLGYLVAKQVDAEGRAVGQGNSPSELDLNALGIQLPPQAYGYKARIRLANNLPDQQMLYDASQSAYDAATRELSAAQLAYDQLLTSASAQAVMKARAGLAVAQERVQVAQDRLSLLQTGEQSPQVAAAAAGLEQAKSSAQQAQEAVGQAQANLSLLDAQLAKLEVSAPMDGVILTRNIEPGEFVQPGAAALSMGDLSQLTITVYVPEDRYGQIHLGQAASVSVDSFAGLQFGGQVKSISDQAEFTPRNVQTVEGRSSTVYAVKLSVDDPGGKLKPGMPADVIFH